MTSWITVVWSVNAGICVALSGMNFAVWVRSRDAWAQLLFAIAAAAAAANALLELALMRAQTPEQFGELLRWFHVPLGVLVVSLVWFVRVYLRTGRPWLAWLVTALRIVVLALTFSLHPNLNFRTITALRPLDAWGETVVVAIGEKNPWTNITHVSGILFLVFVLDAAWSAWRRGEHRRAGVVAATFGAASVVTLVLSELLTHGALPVPLTISFPFLIILLGIAYELSLDLVRAGELASELHESQERMRLAARAANVGVWEWDVARDEFWVIDTIRERRGIGASERIDLARFLNWVHPDDRERTQRAIRDALHGARDFETEYRAVAPGGETRWIAARGRVERGLKGNPLRVRGVSLDVTERKASEVELQTQRGELAHVQRVSAMGQLSSALAHELNQPLGAILRNAEAGELFLQRVPPDYEEVKSILADIKRDDRRAAAVIDRVRSLLRRHQSPQGPLAVGELLEQALALTHGECQARHVSTRVEARDDLPPVRGDPVQLQQVLLNLVMNALDAMERTPPERRRLVVTARRADEQSVEVSVNDSGHGVPADQLSRVFDPFHTTKSKGLGIGLAISRTIVESHGGRIWAENNPDGGATFRFTLSAAPHEPGA